MYQNHKNVSKAQKCIKITKMYQKHKNVLKAQKCIKSTEMYEASM